MDYGWTPQQVGRLTVAQVNMLLEGDEGGTTRFDTLEEALAYQARRKRGE